MKDNSAQPTPSPGRRAAAYWFVDGFPDIVFGLALLISGAAGLVWGLYASHVLVTVYLWFVAAGFFLLYWKSRALLDFLKSRVTYPRTGYVQPPDESVQPHQTLTLLSLQPTPPPDENVSSIQRRSLVLIWYACLNSAHGSGGTARWVVPALMFVIAALLYAISRNSERPFPLWSALVLALTGAPFLWVDVPLGLQPMVPLLLTGMWLSALGGWTLLRYLRANPYPASESIRA